MDFPDWSERSRNVSITHVRKKFRNRKHDPKMFRGGEILCSFFFLSTMVTPWLPHKARRCRYLMEKKCKEAKEVHKKQKVKHRKMREARRDSPKYRLVAHLTDEFKITRGDSKKLIKAAVSMMGTPYNTMETSHDVNRVRAFIYKDMGRVRKASTLSHQLRPRQY